MNSLPTGKQFKLARTSLGKTQIEIARAAGHKLNKTNISNIENGEPVKQYWKQVLQQYYDRIGISFSPDGEQINRSILSVDTQNAIQDETKKAEQARNAALKSPIINFGFTKPQKSSPNGRILLWRGPNKGSRPNL